MMLKNNTGMDHGSTSSSCWVIVSRLILNKKERLYYYLVSICVLYAIVIGNYINCINYFTNLPVNPADVFIDLRASPLDVVVVDLSH